MGKLKEIELGSKKKVRVAEAPFEDAKNLYQVVFSELKAARIEYTTEINANFYKDLALILISSKAVEAALWPCLERCMYGGQKITKETFESADAREDFLEICLLVAKENIGPFVKSLYAQFAPLLGLPADALK